MILHCKSFLNVKTAINLPKTNAYPIVQMPQNNSKGSTTHPAEDLPLHKQKITVQLVSLHDDAEEKENLRRNAQQQQIINIAEF